MALATASKLTLARMLRRMVGAARAAIGHRETEVVCRRRGVRWALDLNEGVQFALYLGVYERQTAAALPAQMTEPAVLSNRNAAMASNVRVCSAQSP